MKFTVGRPHFLAMFRRFTQLRASDVPIYRLCDDASGVLILLMAVFSPWAFGTTEAWSVRVMNGAGYILGGLLLVKLFIRKTKGFPAPRWNSSPSGDDENKGPSISRRATTVLGWLTLAILLYCLVAALNYRATYDPATKFAYRDFLFRWQEWLPHSYDAGRSWQFLWSAFGLAAAFWSVRDWLLGRTSAENSPRQQVTPAIPARLRRLLWILALSGLALGIEGIIQRATGCTKLLFLVQPQVNPDAESQFASYAYRANASQYFNLLWPVCLGLWWRLRQCARPGWKIHLLPVAAAVMAACPVISSSRGGALISSGIMLIAFALILGTEMISKARETGRRWLNILLAGLFLAVALGLGWHFGWEKLSPRMEQIGEGFELREQMYADAQKMAEDYPLFGTGPGTFGSVFQLYRYSQATYWPEQLHNDWLETRITFGWAGFSLFLAALGCVVLAGWRAPKRFAIMAALALAGCLVHARWDFPFQIHSIQFLFLLLCAMLAALGAMRRKTPSKQAVAPEKVFDSTGV